MRIRKNKEGLEVDGTSSPKHLSSIICQLNRSPWDDNFFSQLIEEKWDACLNLNEPPNYVLSDDSWDFHGSESMKLISDTMEISSSPSSNLPQPPLEKQNETEPMKQLQPLSITPLPLLEKPVEEDPLKQVQGVVEPQTLPKPQHGIRSSLRIAKRASNFSSKKLATPPSLPPLPPRATSIVGKKRVRPQKQASTIGSSNVSLNFGASCVSLHSLDDFRYCSRFGPTWGETRNTEKLSNNNNIINNVVIVENKNKNERCSYQNQGSSLSCAIEISDDDDDDDANIITSNKDKKTSNINATSTTKVGVVDMVVEKEFDYILDDFDDDEENDVGFHDGKQFRPRKMIKAWSLKSLM